MAVGIIYLVFCLSNLVLSSFVTRWLGVKVTLVLSSITYVLFIAANIRYHRWVLYLTSFLLGLGAALLWTAHGVYITVSTSEHEQVNNLPTSSTRGLMNGIFFGLFQLNQTVGNLLASFLFRFKYDQWIIFTVMTGFAACGSLTLVFLRSIRIPTDKSNATWSSSVTCDNFFSLGNTSALSSLSILTDLQFLLLIPVMSYSGLAQGFIFAAVPPLITDNSRKFLIFALFGLVSAISSFAFGKLSDFLGRRLISLVIGALSHAIIFLLLLIQWTPPLDENRIGVFVTLTICLSIGDAIFMTQLYSIIAVLYGKTRPTDAFACMKVFQAGFTALGFVQQIYFRFSTQLITLLALLLLTLVTLFYEHYGVVSLDTGIKAPWKNKEQRNRTEIELESQTPLKSSPHSA